MPLWKPSALSTPICFRRSTTDRAAITLCYWYDCSYEEIAETLNLTVPAVKSRLFRARRAMARMMQEQEKEANSAV